MAAVESCAARWLLDALQLPYLRGLRPPMANVTALQRRPPCTGPNGTSEPWARRPWACRRGSACLNQCRACRMVRCRQPAPMYGATDAAERGSNGRCRPAARSREWVYSAGRQRQHQHCDPLVAIKLTRDTRPTAPLGERVAARLPASRRRRRRGGFLNDYNTAGEWLNVRFSSGIVMVPASSGGTSRGDEPVGGLPAPRGRRAA